LEARGNVEKKKKRFGELTINDSYGDGKLKREKTHSGWGGGGTSEEGGTGKGAEGILSFNRKKT